jgi:hypothetical protein
VLTYDHFGNRKQIDMKRRIRLVLVLALIVLSMAIISCNPSTTPEPADIVSVWFGENLDFVDDPDYVDMQQTYTADGYFEWLCTEPGNPEEYYEASQKGTYATASGMLKIQITHFLSNYDPATGVITWEDADYGYGGAIPFEIFGDTLTVSIDLSAWGGSPDTVWTLERRANDGSAELTLDSAAFGIDVAGGSIYVAGEVWDGSQWQSCFWKDSARTDTGGSSARSIYFSTLYGTVDTGGQKGGRPYFWSDTNGFPLDTGHYLESFVGIVRSITPYAGTYLAAGTDHTTTGLPSWHPYEPVLWAGSNNRVVLTGGSPGDAYSVYVSNNTWYVAGRLFYT